MLAANAADFGNIVRSRRIDRGLSQVELADLIGVSRKWIADLERGHPRAQLQLVVDALNALGALVDVVDAPSERLPAEVPAERATSAGHISVSEGLQSALANYAQVAGALPSVAVPRLPPETTAALAAAADQDWLSRGALESIQASLAGSIGVYGALDALRESSRAVLDPQAQRAFRELSNTLAHADMARWLSPKRSGTGGVGDGGGDSGA